MTAPRSTTSIADYLAGYVAGYWAGYDFAIDEPGLREGEEEKPGPGGSASDSADAPTTAPERDLSSRRSAPAHAQGGPESSRPSAVSSLPAIRQPALPPGMKGKVELEGELERIHAHRGMVAGLRSLEEYLKRLGKTDAALLANAAASNWDVTEVLGEGTP